MNYLNKISYKIGAYILIVVFLSLALFGTIYIRKYSENINQRIKSQIAMPSKLIAKNMLDIESINQPDFIEQLTGLKIVQCFIVGINKNVYYASDPLMLNLKIDQVSEFSPYFTDFEVKSGVLFKHGVIEKSRYLIDISPIYLENNKLLGVLFIKSDVSQFKKAKINFLLFYILGSFFCILIITFIVIWIIDKNLINRINIISNVLEKLKSGLLVQKIDNISRNDELGNLEKDTNILIENLDQKAHFANEIEKKNFLYDYKAVSDQDELGSALINMRDSLQKAVLEEENRRLEDTHRNWATQGLAKFGDILRQHYDNIKELSFTIISELVNYLDANQASIFLINDDDLKNKYLELSASYAFDRRKYQSKKIAIGEGLVGSCAYEKQTIFLTEIPDTYIEITSGLGKSNPNALLIVPLLREENLLGVLEIASFNKFESYQIEFVEKLGESIASTLFNVKINTQTAYLLSQSQEQTEEMRAQEEEMRQNMEELHATQEEMSRKQEELVNKIKDLEQELEKKNKEIEKYKPRE